MIPPLQRKDRVDIYRRSTDVVSQEVTAVETAIARGVRCSLRTDDASELASIFGQSMETQRTRLWMGKRPKLLAGYQIVECKTGTRYTVTSVAYYPAPHRFDNQVAVLQVDQTVEVG